jgi:hypothetical protein
MNKKCHLSPAQQRQVVIERMWLRYYNDTLLAKGIITETQHRKMQAKICSRTTPVGTAHS